MADSYNPGYAADYSRDAGSHRRRPFAQTGVAGYMRRLQRSVWSLIAAAPAFAGAPSALTAQTTASDKSEAIAPLLPPGISDFDLELFTENALEVARTERLRELAESKRRWVDGGRSHPSTNWLERRQSYAPRTLIGDWERSLSLLHDGDENHRERLRHYLSDVKNLELTMAALLIGDAMGLHKVNKIPCGVAL